MCIRDRTNAAGVAQVAVPAGSVTGAYAATASITVGGRALTASANYTATIPPVAPVPTPPPPTLTLALINPAGASAGVDKVSVGKVTA